MNLKKLFSMSTYLWLVIAMGLTVAACSASEDSASNEPLNLIPAINTNCGNTSCVK